MNESNLSMVEKEKKLKLIKDHIGEFPDFPEKGVLFRYNFFFFSSKINTNQS